MATTYFDVVPVGTQWVMKVEGQDQTWCYPTRDQALNMAMDSARSLWERWGVRCAVRLQQQDGRWQRKRSFGGVTPLPESHGASASFSQISADN